MLSKLKILTITLSAWAVWPHRGKGLIYALLDSAILCILCGLEECHVGEDLKGKSERKSSLSIYTNKTVIACYELKNISGVKSFFFFVNLFCSGQV